MHLNLESHTKQIKLCYITPFPWRNTETRIGNSFLMSFHCNRYYISIFAGFFVGVRVVRHVFASIHCSEQKRIWFSFFPSRLIHRRNLQIISTIDVFDVDRYASKHIIAHIVLMSFIASIYRNKGGEGENFITQWQRWCGVLVYPVSKAIHWLWHVLCGGTYNNHRLYWHRFNKYSIRDGCFQSQTSVRTFSVTFISSQVISVNFWWCAPPFIFMLHRAWLRWWHRPTKKLSNNIEFRRREGKMYAVSRNRQKSLQPSKKKADEKSELKKRYAIQMVFSWQLLSGLS